jgi:hypothetical protein
MPKAANKAERDARTRKIKRLHAGGMGRQAIADAVGVSYDTVRTVVDPEYRLSKKRRKAATWKEQRAKPPEDKAPRGKTILGQWLLGDDGIIDELAIEIAVSGSRVVRLTWPERMLAARRIVAMNLDLRDLVERLGLGADDTKRVLAELGLEVVRGDWGGGPGKLVPLDRDKAKSLPEHVPSVKPDRIGGA